MTNTSAGPDRLLNQNEVAALLGCSARTLEKKRVTGGGPIFIKVGSHVRYRASDLDAWIASNTHASTSSAAVRAA